MNFPSISEIWTSFTSVWRRFPVAMFFASLATILGIYTNHQPYYMEETMMPWILTALFSFGVAVAADTYSESVGKYRGLLRMLVCVLAVPFYYFFFRHFANWNDVDMLRFVMMILIVGFLILVAPFLRKGIGHDHGFWQYVVLWALRVFFAAVYFALLFLGLAAFLASVDYLFSVNVPDELFFDLWLLITGLMVSTFVLAGVPEKYQNLGKMNYLPVAVQVLIKYFLMPLAALYLLVLYIYTLTILVNAEWPEGGVAGWIIGYSFVAITVYFFSFYMKVDVFYVKHFQKWLFPLLLPLVLVLFGAVGVRIAEYGVTELRYFGVVYGIWLLVLVAVFVLMKKKDVRVLPLTLILFLFFTSWGPLSAFSISHDSQYDRLENLLIENGILLDGEIVPVEGSIADADHQSISSIVQYLVRNFGVEDFDPWFEEDLEQKVEDDGYWTVSDYIVNEMGLEPYYSIARSDYQYFSFNNGCESEVCVKELDTYQYLIDNVYLSRHDEFDAEYKRFRFEEDGAQYYFKLADGRLQLVNLDTDAVWDLLGIDIVLAELGDSIGSLNELEYPISNDLFQGVLRFQSLEFSGTKSEEDLTMLNFSLLYNLK